MRNYLKAYDGRECPIDLENPLVMIKGSDFGNNYERGAMVYPIGNHGEKPGHHGSEGWMTVSVLTKPANFCGVEVGKTAVPLKELLRTSAQSLGITYGKRGFWKDGEKTKDRLAVDMLLDHYATMQLPEEVRKASELSKIVSSEPTSYERGIIFEKLENLGAALIMYDMGFTKASTATRDKLYADMWKENHPKMGVDDPTIFRNTTKAKLVSLGELMNKARGGLVERLVSDIITSGGEYRKSFDYDGMGTAFFKTSVEVEKIDDKYILGLWAAYVGDEPEKELAEVLERDRGLVRIGSRHEINPIANRWIGVDVEKAMKNGALSKKQISVLTRLSAGEMRSDDEYVVNMNGMSLNVSLDLGQEENYRANVIRARGNQLFMEMEGEGKPYFSFSLEPVGKNKIVNSEEKERITKARDDLSALVQTNLLW